MIITIKEKGGNMRNAFLFGLLVLVGAGNAYAVSALPGSRQTVGNGTMRRDARAGIQSQTKSQ